MRKKLDLVIAGVGGQGNILLSRMVGQAAARAGMEVRISEAFGSAQRGGAVFSNVRLGKSYSSVIPLGKADALLALEPGEALRQSRFLARNGLALISSKPLMPVEVLAGKAAYPSVEKIGHLMKELASKVFMIDASALAEQAGDARTANTVMLGALDGCHILPFRSDLLRETMISAIPSKMVEANLKAFDLGRVSMLNSSMSPH